MKQVITIAPDGAMSGLQMKPGKGVDLRQFGRADIQRVSEILWSKEQQRWYIEGVTGIIKGHIFRHDEYWGSGIMVEGAGGPWAEGADHMRAPHAIMFFEDYDMAVAAEIYTLNRMRRGGRF